MSKELRDNLRDVGLLVLRVGFALPMLVYHGWGKWVNFGERAPEFFDPLGLGPTTSLALAIFAEVICALLLIVGFATRLAAAAVVANFAVILFIVQQGKTFDELELPLLFWICAIVVALTGPGRLSVDAAIGFLRD